MAKRKRLITIGIVFLGIAFLGFVAWWAGRILLGLALVFLVGEAIQDEGLFDFDHSSVQVVGHFSDSDAESNYALICNGLSLTFPDGTTIDQHDNAWDRIVCSFQFESGSAMPSLTAEQFQPCERLSLIHI